MLLETLGESQHAPTDILCTVIISYVALDNANKVHVAVISQARSQGGQEVNRPPSLLCPGLKYTFYPL